MKSANRTDGVDGPRKQEGHLHEYERYLPCGVHFKTSGWAFAALFEEQSLSLEGERLEQAAQWGIPDVINQCCYGEWESARWIGARKASRLLERRKSC